MLCVPGISKFFGPFEGLNAVQVLISQSSEALLKVVVEIFGVFEFVLRSTSVECDPGAVKRLGISSFSGCLQKVLILEPIERALPLLGFDRRSK